MPFQRAFFRQLLLLVCIGGIVHGALFARQQAEGSGQDTLATIGPDIIMVGDLDERIGLMLWPGKNQLSKIDSVKVEALNSLVAEKLLALRGTELQLSTDPSTQAMRRSLERLLARDQLYKREVLAKITLGSAEIASGLSRYARQLRVRVVVAATLSSAVIVRTMMEHRVQHDSLQSETIGPLVVGQDTLEIRFGKTSQEFEDRVYALHEGEVSLPIVMDPFGWVVVELLDWRTNPDYAKQSLSERRLTVQRILKDRKRDVRAVQYFSATLSPESATVEPEALKLLADSLRTLIVQDSTDRSVSGHYHSRPSDVERLRECLGDHLETILVRFDNGGLTIGEAIEALRYQAFLFRSLRRNDFLVEVSEMLKKIVEGELLTREAMKKHLQNTADVRHDLAIWSDYWSANALAKIISDTIQANDDEIAAHLFKKNPALGNSNFVDIREIFSDSLRKALQLAIRIRQGESLAELAGTLTERKEWSVRQGQSGFFPIAEHPVIGVAAMNADTGVLVGPLHAEHGYSLFEVLGKRLRRGLDQRLDSLATVSRDEVIAQKQVEAIERYVATLADRFPVTLKYENLRKLQIQPFQMVTKRLIGFGGAIPAAPPLAPLTGWAKRQAKVNQLFQ
jgi:hypothetical protein